MGLGPQTRSDQCWATVVAPMLVSKPVPVAGEWYQSDGVIILEFGTIFRRSPWGCGIQRTPGDKSWPKNETNNVSPGVLM